MLSCRCSPRQFLCASSTHSSAICIQGSIGRKLPVRFCLPTDDEGNRKGSELTGIFTFRSQFVFWMFTGPWEHGDNGQLRQGRELLRQKYADFLLSRALAVPD
jgi:hypothetical protein